MKVFVTFKGLFKYQLLIILPNIIHTLGRNWFFQVINLFSKKKRLILLYIKQITGNYLLYIIGNSTQYSVISYMGEEYKSEIRKKKAYITIYKADNW